jgi:DNA-binding XRE family transcriptional regulator
LVIEMTNLRTARARKKMTRLRARGMTLQAIANVFGLTRQAVHYALVGIRHASKMICCSACKQAIRHQENYLHNLPVLCVRCVERRATTFAERLRALRVDMGLTAKELAKRAGLSEATVTLTERGLHNPRPRTIAKLVAVLGIRLHTPDLW